MKEEFGPQITQMNADNTGMMVLLGGIGSGPQMAQMNADKIGMGVRLGGMKYKSDTIPTTTKRIHLRSSA